MSALRCQLPGCESLRKEGRRANYPRYSDYNWYFYKYRSQPPNTREVIGNCQHYHYYSRPKRATVRGTKVYSEVEIRDNESHIIKMGDHTCTAYANQQRRIIKYYQQQKYVVLSTNIKSTRGIAAALDVPYNRALYMKGRRQLAKQQTTAADKWWSDLR